MYDQKINHHKLIDNEDLIIILHVGSYKTEPQSIKLMDDFIKTHNLKKNGFHHEIYLSDQNKTEPDKLKTILRQPVE